MKSPSRAEALNLVHTHVQSQSLRRHMFAVEAAMRAYARRFDEDEDLYGLTGLLHDFDYESRPDQHPLPGAETLRENGYPEELVHAVLAHNEPLTGVTPTSLLDRTLRACDEITGLITAAALVRPSRSVMDLEAKSVLKKFKDRGFAAGVDRDEVEVCVRELGMDLREHTQFVIEAMRGIANELGLAMPRSSTPEEGEG